MGDNEPVSRRTRSKEAITPSKSEREMRAQLRAEASDQFRRSSNAGGPAKRRKKDNRSTKSHASGAGRMISNLRPVNNLQDMPHDMLARIFELIAASDGNYLYSNKKYTEDDVRSAH